MEDSKRNLDAQGYDIQKLEEQIFGDEVEEEEDILSNTSLRIMKRQQRKHSRSESNVQRNESLSKYHLSARILNYVKSQSVCIF